ncbi:PREDICTED: cyclin-dependent kinase 12 [Theobroma cacao]|uniref:Cyclin-dependent kinase 12 n=1 Tax=Theobroma cacao TaxID=3641 RepID=A0AB32V9H3_THECC|nr:PREDICTED: cyclin-dependent kinase 12 [Theobroma cacao]
MGGLKMSWFPLILLLSLTINNLSEASRKLHSAVVVGTVYCDTCFQEDISKAAHLISGASVAVECKDGTSRPSFRQEVRTNEHGDFKVHLPFSVGKHVKKIKRCSVKLIRSSEPYCAVASTATSSSLHLKSGEQGTHIFSAGFFAFKPLKQPNICNQKPSVEDSKQVNTQNTLRFGQPNFPTFPPPLAQPATPQPSPLLPNLPPLPQLPPLPPLPSLPGLPIPPIPGRN